MASDAARAFERLVELVATLRSPQGCPWDRAQTLASLRPFVLEETYEVLHALDAGDYEALCEELGDLIFEGVLLAQVCAESGRFTVTDSLHTIVDKLVRRHAHVFGQAPKAETPDEVLGRWEAVKARERAGQARPATLLSGVPATLPALLRAYELSSRAATVGFDWERASDVMAKIEEEIAELRHALADSRADRSADVEEEMGDLLFAIANLSRKLGVEPEAALRKANGKFTRRFGELERRIAARGLTVPEVPLEDLEVEWQQIKADETRA